MNYYIEFGKYVLTNKYIDCDKQLGKYKDLYICKEEDCTNCEKIGTYKEGKFVFEDNLKNVEYKYRQVRKIFDVESIQKLELIFVSGKYIYNINKQFMCNQLKNIANLMITEHTQNYSDKKELCVQLVSTNEGIFEFSPLFSINESKENMLFTNKKDFSTKVNLEKEQIMNRLEEK